MLTSSSFIRKRESLAECESYLQSRAEQCAAKLYPEAVVQWSSPVARA